MYVVAGVTGNTGKIVADTLLAQGKAVRVVGRDAAKLEGWKKRGAEVAITDLDDAAGLERALTGATGAYLLLPPQYASTDTLRDNAARARAIASAIDASGVGHVVFLSSIGAQHASGNGPIASLHDAEVVLGKTKAAVTFLRAAYFMENWGGSLFALASGALPTFIKADLTLPMVATADIGAAAARALAEGGRGKSVIELSGPRDYSPRDVAAALSRVVGKPIAAQEAPESAMVAALTGAGMNEHWAKLFQEMTHGINTGHVAPEGGAARALRGKTEIDAVLAALVKG